LATVAPGMGSVDLLVFLRHHPVALPGGGTVAVAVHRTAAHGVCGAGKTAPAAAAAAVVIAGVGGAAGGRVLAGPQVSERVEDESHGSDLGADTACRQGEVRWVGKRRCVGRKTGAS